MLEVRYKYEISESFKHPSVSEMMKSTARNLRRSRQRIFSFDIGANLRTSNRRSRIAASVACLQISWICTNRTPLGICIALTRRIDHGAIFYKDSPSRALTDGTILDPSAIPRDSPLGSFRGTT